VGGAGPDGAPTATAYVGTPEAATGKITAWTESTDLALLAPRADAAVVVSGDGIFLVGGRDAAGPVATVWKAPLDTKTGKLKKWVATAPLPAARVDATAVLLGTHLFVYGGEDPAGPATAVVRGEVVASGEAAGTISGWSPPTQDAAASTNLPAARRGAMGFVSNGTLYYAGGDGGGELYWAIPDAEGNVGGWKTLEQSSLPAKLELAGAAPIVAGSHAFLVGGTAAGSPTQGIARTSLSPPQPFFQVGLFYVVVPALGIKDEVGQQLSYLAAAGVATGNFVLLLLIGYAYNHKAQTRAFWERVRSRRRGTG